jgi:effector-binding domain-containing protein
MKLIPITLLIALSACTVRSQAPINLGPTTARWSAGYVDLQVSHPPFEQVEANWKVRMQVPYVYLEHRGAYGDTGALIPVLQAELSAQGLVPDGPPFCLFYDDPGVTPTEGLQSRACIPIHSKAPVLAPLAFGLLPSTTVAYAFASGAYPDVPQAWPGILAYVERQHWVPGGPVREIYLVAPEAEPDLGQLMSEIEIPVRSTR